MGETVLCPRCGENYYTPYGEKHEPGSPPFPALSRVDNKTYICSECGTDEAMRDFTGAGPTPLDEWAIPPSPSGRYFIIYTSEYEDPWSMIGPFPTFDEALESYWQRVLDAGYEAEEWENAHQSYLTDDAVKIGRVIGGP